MIAIGHRRASGFAAAILAAALAGCATPSQRISAVLVEQGFEPGYARCVGDRLERRLSTAQLLKLKRAAAFSRPRPDGTPPRLDLMLREVGDPSIPLEAMAAGLACGFAG